MSGSITSNVNNITQAEAADSANWDDIGGGPGSAQVDGFLIQGLNARGRRIDTAIRGFSYDSTTTLDISGSHVGFWVLVSQPNLINVDGIELLIGDSATPKAGNWSGWFYDETTYPIPGGWIRIWLDPTATRDTGAGTVNLTTIRQFGCEFDIGNVGGTGESCILDRIDYTNSLSGGLLVYSGSVGSPATFADFLAADEGNDTNRYGIIQSRDGIYFVNGRLIIGSGTTSTDFIDSSFTTVFSDQRLCSDTFMGVTVNLTNTGSAVDISNATIKSGGALKKGDLIVTGSAGTFDATAIVFDSVRQLQLGTGCVFDTCTLVSCGEITCSSPFTFATGTISNGTNLSGTVIWNIPYDINPYVSETTFNSAGTGHAIQIGVDCPDEMTFPYLYFNDYASVNGTTGNEAVWVRKTTGSLTLNILGGDIPSIRTDGATVTIPPAPYILTLNGVESGSYVTIVQDYDTSPVELYFTGSTPAGGTVQYQYNYVSDLDVVVLITSLSQENTYIDLVLSNANQQIPVQQNFDRIYRND